ncbi:BQ2448_1759 [Microbotryum intermedium]|uniref:BQ2448_1759 protein n=1 Tax=Microbotryum intermedium TaxID=269621 RepID=A0A238FAY3_9BASI|nr:BQ2448_1759 [Microbotryum intermedium]
MSSSRTFSQLVRQGCLLSAVILLVLAVQVSAHEVEETIFQRSGHRLAKRAPISSIPFKIVTSLPKNVTQCAPLKLKFGLGSSKKHAPALTVLLVDPALVTSKLRTRTVKLAEISKLSPYQSLTSRSDGESFKFNLMVQEGASFELFAFYKNGTGKWLNNTRTVGASNSSSCLPTCKASQFRTKYNTCRSCKSVHANAASCNGTVATHCAPFYLFQGRCSAYCPTGYYQNTTTLCQCYDLFVDQGHVLLVRKSRQRNVPSREMLRCHLPQHEG